MDGPRRESSRTTLRSASLSLSACLAACSFDAAGLGGTGPVDLGGTGTGTGTADSGPGGETASSGGPGGDGDGSGSSGGGGSSGPVEPMTSTTDEPMTSTTGEPMTSTTGEPSTSSSGCVEHEFYKDGDGDGFGAVNGSVFACELPAGYVLNADDCDDLDMAAFPGAEEVCDTVDNDCDAVIDEFTPSNTACGGCDMALYVPNDTVYHFCKDVKKWAAARVACEQRDGVLAKDEDDTHHAWLLQQLMPGSGPWWIGASSPNANDMFVWLVDGSPVPPAADPRWTVGHPSLGGMDRMVLVAEGSPFPWITESGKWYDRGDIDNQPYICQSEYKP